MPRFENEGFNPNIRQDVDRTVPQDENYYSSLPVDLNFNNKSEFIRDNQNANSGINPCNTVDNNPQPEQYFRSETPEDYRARQNANRQAPPYQARQYQNAQPQYREPRRDERQARPNKRAIRKKRRIKLIALLLVALIVVLTIGGTGFAALGRINYLDKQDNDYVSASSLMHSDDVKNVLLLGVDARNDENPEETRSDTMMLVSIDTVNHEIKLTSFLRDSWVYIPSLGYNQRLNAACSAGGYQGVVDAIEYNYGVDVDGYAVVDFEMFKVLVDSLGGVEVDVTEEEANEVTNNPERYGWVTLDSGKYTLTGEQALAYCRIRKIDTDFVRTERQRTVMTAILNNAKHSSPTKLIKMLYNSAPYISTDLSKGEIMSFAMSALGCLGTIEQEKVPFEGTWDYETISGNSVIGLDIEENSQMLQDYIYG